MLRHQGLYFQNCKHRHSNDRKRVSHQSFLLDNVRAFLSVPHAAQHRWFLHLSQTKQKHLRVQWEVYLRPKHLNLLATATSTRSRDGKVLPREGCPEVEILWGVRWWWTDQDTYIAHGRSRSKERVKRSLRQPDRLYEWPIRRRCALSKAALKKQYLLWKFSRLWHKVHPSSRWSTP